MQSKCLFLFARFQNISHKLESLNEAQPDSSLKIVIVVLFSNISIVYFFSFLNQFNVPFKIISLIETSQSIGGAKREYPGKTT